VLTIESALLEWLTDDEVSLVLIDAEGEKAFCAGGDVAMLYQQGAAGDTASGCQFWRDEYRLNALIDSYPKPYVAIMDGIVMGGGIGISAHGSHRIVTERSTLALPECSIGLVPDVGSTHLLARAPGHIGEYLGLTGERFNASDALFTGFADFHVPVARLDDLKHALVQSGDVNVIEEFQESTTRSTLADRRPDIDSVFGAATIRDVMGKLSDIDSELTRSAAKRMCASSPMSLMLTFDLIRESRSTPGLALALVREYRFVSRSMEYADILEGVRAAIIDKDRDPQWKYPSMTVVPPDLISWLQGEAPGGDPVFHSQQTES